MRWLSRKKKGSASSSGTYEVPSERELYDKLRDIDEVNQRIADNPQMQEIMRQMLGEDPGEKSGSSMEEMSGNLASGGLSYLAPPADLPGIAPDAHQLWLGEAFLGSMRGDDAYSLEKFNEALVTVREKSYVAAEARLLYNIGIAHYKLGDLQEAIAVLLEGRAVTEQATDELEAEARKLQRVEEDVKTDRPSVDVAGVPFSERWLLGRYLDALAIVYDASGQPDKAAECRNESKRLHLKGA